MSNKLRVAALISGGGTTMDSLIDATKTGRLSYVEVVLVVASNDKAGGIAKALKRGLAPEDVIVRKRKDYATAEEYGEVLLAEFKQRGVDFFGQYGWMVYTPANVIAMYELMCTNQHPGPVRPGHPDFGGPGMFGARVHAARLQFVAATKRNYWTEAICQRVHPEADRGAVINYRRVSIEQYGGYAGCLRDDVQSLKAKLLPIEHEVQIEALDAFSRNQARLVSLSNDLVRPEEAEILAQAKANAIQTYPQG